MISGGGFHATASDNGWSLDLRIKAFWPPNMSVAAGLVRFYPGGSKMLFGYEYAWNASGTNAILLIGKMTCKRSKRRS